MASVKSPCKSVCQLIPGTETCKACKRTVEEITNWYDYTPAERKAVVKRIKEKDGRTR
jgi:predicted Fe-S protein YdhL (DUF1289 family)